MRRPLVTIYLAIIGVFLILTAPFFVILAWEMIMHHQMNILDNMFLIIIIFCFPIVLLLAIGLLKPQIKELMRRGGL